MNVQAGAKTVGTFLDVYLINYVPCCNMKSMESYGRDVQFNFLTNFACQWTSKNIASYDIYQSITCCSVVFWIGLCAVIGRLDKTFRRNVGVCCLQTGCGRI